MPKPLSIGTKLDDFPPVVVRLLARHPAKKVNGDPLAMTDEDIARRAKLLVSEVRHLSQLTSWDTVEVATMRAFLIGCGADLDDRRWLQRNRQYMRDGRRGISRYLLNSPQWETTFARLCRIAAQHGGRAA